MSIPSPAQQFLAGDNPYIPQIKSWIIDELHCNVEDVVDVWVFIQPCDPPFQYSLKEVMFSATFHDTSYRKIFFEEIKQERAEIANAKIVGAVGDGLADDTVAVQAAIDRAWK